MSSFPAIARAIPGAGPACAAPPMANAFTPASAPVLQLQPKYNAPVKEQMCKALVK